MDEFLKACVNADIDITIENACLRDENGADLECLPMWNIQLENGDIMAAYPEEICLAERK